MDKIGNQGVSLLAKASMPRLKKLTLCNYIEDEDDDQFDAKGIRVLCESSLKIKELIIRNSNARDYGVCRYLSRADFPL